jgi:hypothetical protein
MKWFTILLSIFMMVLSCIPCADAAEIDTLASTSIQANPDAENHAPEADLCSPLCICNCCAGFALQTSVQKTSPAILMATTTAPVHRAVAVSNPSFIIWQPPKL